MTNICSYEEGCSLPSSSNKLEILLRQLKRELADLVKTTEYKLLQHDGKIAEMCVYLKTNLSNSIRELLDSMNLSGELSDIITETVISRIADLESEVEVTLSNVISEVNHILENNNPYYDGIETIKKRDTLTQTDYYITKIPRKYKDGKLIKLEIGLANDSTSVNSLESTLDFAHRKNATLCINAGVFDVSDNTALGILIKDGIILSNEKIEDSKYQYLGIDENYNYKVYPHTITAQEMLNDGMKNAICIFGPLIVDGNIQDQSDDRVEPRQSIGFTKDNDIIIITCDGRSTTNLGMKYSDLARLHAENGSVNAHILDGGGSTATVLRGIKQNDNVDNNYIDRKVGTFLYIRKDNNVPVESNLYNELGKVKQALIEDIINNTFPRGWTRLSGPVGYFAPGLEMCVNGETSRRTKIGLSIDDNNERNSYLYMSLKPTSTSSEKTNLFRIYNHGVWVQTYHGPSSARPNGNGLVGLCYFDETINKPIWYDGTKWVDSTGTQV
jgi:exopolysaccharide biosynthesis protein